MLPWKLLKVMKLVAMLAKLVPAKLNRSLHKPLVQVGPQGVELKTSD